MTNKFASGLPIQHIRALHRFLLSIYTDDQRSPSPPGRPDATFSINHRSFFRSDIRRSRSPVSLLKYHSARRPPGQPSQSQVFPLRPARETGSSPRSLVGFPSGNYRGFQATMPSCSCGPGTDACGDRRCRLPLIIGPRTGVMPQLTPCRAGSRRGASGVPPAGDLIARPPRRGQLRRETHGPQRSARRLAMAPPSGPAPRLTAENWAELLHERDGRTPRCHDIEPAGHGAFELHRPRPGAALSADDQPSPRRSQAVSSARFARVRGSSPRSIRPSEGFHADEPDLGREVKQRQDLACLPMHWFSALNYEPDPQTARRCPRAPSRGRSQAAFSSKLPAQPGC